MSIIVSIGLWIVSGIYHVVSWAFQLFLILASGTIVEPDTYQQIINNVYVLIGIIMLFVLAFALLRGIINPDDQKQGTSTVKKVIVNLITSAIIMVLLPTIFTFAFDVQKSVVTDYNLIGKFFGYGNPGSTNDNPSSQDNLDKIKVGANQIVNGVFTAFFYVKDDACGNESVEDCTITTDGRDEKNYPQVVAEVDQTGSFSTYSIFSDFVDEKIEFNFILSLIAGLILLYVVVSFCFDMALRFVKLVFYQLIAPIPIFFRIMPSGDSNKPFNNWVKKTLTCYLEVYVRILVVYFCIYLATLIRDGGFFETIEGGFISVLAKAFVYMGLIMFMRQAPKLLSEVTGIDSGNMKLGIKEKLKDGGFFAAGNAVGSLATSGGNPLAAIRGAKHGWKNADFKNLGAEAQRRRDRKDAIESGVTRGQLALNAIRDAFGFDTTADAALRRIEEESEMVKNRTGNDIKGIHFEENGNLYEGQVFDNVGNALTYKNGKYLDANGDEYTGQLHAGDGRKIYNIIGNKGAYYDENNKRYSGLLFTNDGRVVSFNHEKNIYEDENGNIYNGQLYTKDGNKLTGIATQEIKYDKRVTSILESLEAERISDMSKANDEIRALESQISDGDAQISFKSNVKGEAEKKILEEGSEVKYNFIYKNPDGSEGNFYGSFEQIKEFANNTLASQGIAVDLDVVKDAMIDQYISQELKKNSSKIKQDLRSGLDSLVYNNGYEYQYTSKEIIDGKEVEVIKKAKIEVIKNEATGKYTIKEFKDGIENEILNDADADWEEKVYRSVVSKIDKAAKDSNGILRSKKQKIQETVIDPFKVQNDATANLGKQAQESKDAKKKSQEQKAKEAAKKHYQGNRGGK